MTRVFCSWATLLVMFDPPKVRKVKILKLLWGFFRRQFAYFCLFWHLNRPRPAAQWVRPNFFGPEGGQTIPPHHSIAKYLKNLKSTLRTGTFILRHCVKKLYSTFVRLLPVKVAFVKRDNTIHLSVDLLKLNCFFLH